MVEARFQWDGVSLNSSDQVLLNHWFTMLAFRSENRFKNVPFVCVLYVSTILWQRSLKVPGVFNLLFMEPVL